MLELDELLTAEERVDDEERELASTDVAVDERLLEITELLEKIERLETIELLETKELVCELLLED